MNKGKMMLALSECADALCIAKEQMRRASRLLGQISVATANSDQDPDSNTAARLAAGVDKVIEPIRMDVQARHDRMAAEFINDWRS